jgi:hypothetical protein
MSRYEDSGDSDLWIVLTIIVIIVAVGSLMGLAEATENEMEIIPTGDGCVLVVYKENNLFGEDRDYSGRYCQR